MTTSVRYELLGDQRPRLSHSPASLRSAGQAAVELAKITGLTPDPWQEWCIEQILAEREDSYFNEVLGLRMPRSAAYESALVVARQNGKGSILEILELAWLFLLGAKTILHSAHEFPTAREGFQRIESLITGTPELAAEVARGGIKWSHGDESITLKSGQRLLFKTRTKGAARGFSIDKLILDEAMILKNEQVAAMLPATSARPDVQILYTGSAGDKDSEHFGRARSRGIAGSDPRLFFAEWSIDGCNEFCTPDCDEHDDPTKPESWAKANPGLGIRLSQENIQSELLGMDREVFLRERLSVGDWPVDGDAWSVISEEAWMSRLDEASAAQGPFTLGVDTTPDLRHSTIVVCGRNGEQKVHVEITGKGRKDDHQPGVRWVIARLDEIIKNIQPKYVVIDKGSQAGRFVDELIEKGHEKLLLHPTAREYAQACGEFYTSVVPIKGSTPDLAHLNQTQLTTAVAGAEKRDLADLWAWDKRNATQVISPLCAATLAMWGLKKYETEPETVAPWVVRR